MKNSVMPGSRNAIRYWLLQRVTAFLMVLYTVVVLCRVLCMPVWDYRSWVEVFSPRWFQIFTLFIFASLCFHSWVGMRDIAMDYIKPLCLRLAFYIVIVFLLICYMFWAFEILQGVN
ncbi:MULTISPECIES: succinate dehydrogenase, hydrophobic membrane anchor protein [Candidatus Ichthyocystis]|uniref:succinate dehydrogenase, hydrophobic membrane anchor protein n=1 Tax=Candidatus Ichthyocystis TaxID=2929841 RepID=UPI000B83403C|nr:MULTISPECIES: succinate dehydrogenase, hydrophobic membrane anchor protein [Ichthyocystis]